MTPRRYLQEREMVITASRTMNEMDGGHLGSGDCSQVAGYYSDECGLSQKT